MRTVASTAGGGVCTRRCVLCGGSALLVLAAGGWAALRTTPPRWQVCDAVLQPGDLLFRRTVSFEGLSVQVLDAAGRFSHVGLVVGHGPHGVARVVHACPPERAGQAGVRETTAQAFVSGSDVRDAAAARLSLSAAQARQMAAWALQHVGWAFNSTFRLDAPRALYCTELVWAAMRAAHCACLPRTALWRTPLGAFEVVPMSALLALPGMRFLPEAVRTTQTAGQTVS